ncbi:MAG: hypothetical protein NC131_02105 [Roseburia sp.]|nr:hypothetical protein [Roseburia sp.]
MAISAEKKREMRVLEQFYEFNEKLILNLKFSRDKIETVADGFEHVKRIMRGDETIKGEHGDFLLSYLHDIGKTDAPTQIDYLNEKGQTLEKLKNESGEKYKKYGSLYFKLSLMAGVLIAVLLA